MRKMFKRFSNWLFGKGKVESVPFEKEAYSENPFSDRCTFGPVEGLTWVCARRSPYIGVDANGKILSPDECIKVYNDSLTYKGRQ